jgi:ABC-type branched-subunit amino acid transport system substrate-binding protein
MSSMTRRAALAGGLALPFAAHAQTTSGTGAALQQQPIRIGTITPLTGAGSAYGPAMAKVAKTLADDINAAGGVGGRQIVLSQEDDETNPDAGVRAAHKLIDVDKVIAICGTWASAVTTAVAPLCWENKVMLFTTSGADSITRLPHQGYIIRTQPNTALQSQRAGQFLLQQGAKRVFDLSVQAPFSTDTYNALGATLKQGGAETIGLVIYDQTKSSFRSEVDQALKDKPDTLFLNSYQPDLVVLLRDLYRAGYGGKRLTYGYAANDKLLAALPPDVTNGLMSFSPSPDPDSPAYKRVTQILGGGTPDPYSCQIYDHIALCALSIAKANASSGVAIHDTVREISQGKGEKVSDPIAGLKLLAQGKDVNYEGASGPCDFLPSGDIENCKFRFDVADGKGYRTLSIS